MLKGSNVRKGFFEARRISKALKDALPDELKPLVTFAYHSGWRKTEILGLDVGQGRLKEGIVRLDPGETKNEEGRTLYLDGELMRGAEAFREPPPRCSFVFHRNGQPIRDFRGSWDAACIKAGLCEILKDDEGRPVVIKNKKGKGEVV